jgi:hypothetical protein
MSDLDNEIKAHARRNIIAWMYNAAWLFAGMAIGILIRQAIG